MEDIKTLSLKILLDLADQQKDAVYINACEIVRAEYLKPDKTVSKDVGKNSNENGM